MLYGCTSWPWVLRKAFVGTAADLSTAKLFHPCPGAVTWHVTNPVAGTISVVGPDAFFIPAAGFCGHAFVVGVHANARCMIPFRVVPDHAPLYGRDWPSVAPNFRLYPTIPDVALDRHIRPRIGGFDWLNQFYPDVFTGRHSHTTPLSDYFGYIWLQDDWTNTGDYVARTDYPFSSPVARTLTLVGTGGAAPRTITATVTGGALACRFHLVEAASDFGGPANRWVCLADGERGSSILASSALSIQYQLTEPGTYGVLAVDDWDNFLFDLSNTPTVT